MFSKHSLHLYNDKPGYFREAGRRFNFSHTQIVQHLGMPVDGVPGAFIGRLVERAAFLCIRIRGKRNSEQPDLTLRILPHPVPLCHTPVSVTAIVATKPHRPFPQWHSQIELPRGSRIVPNDVSLNIKPTAFTMVRYIKVQPVEVSSAERKILPPRYLPEGAARQISDLPARTWPSVNTYRVLSRLCCTYWREYAEPEHWLKVVPVEKGCGNLLLILVLYAINIQHTEDASDRIPHNAPDRKNAAVPLSIRLETVVKRGLLMCQLAEMPAAAVPPVHILPGILQHPTLQRGLCRLNEQFKKLPTPQLFDDYLILVGDSNALISIGIAGESNSHIPIRTSVTGSSKRYAGVSVNTTGSLASPTTDGSTSMAVYSISFTGVGRFETDTGLKMVGMQSKN